MSDSGVGLVNMSFTGPQDDVVQKRIESMSAKGVVFTAAAGNDGPTAGTGLPRRLSAGDCGNGGDKGIKELPLRQPRRAYRYRGTRRRYLDGFSTSAGRIPFRYLVRVTLRYRYLGNLSTKRAARSQETAFLTTVNVTDLGRARAGIRFTAGVSCRLRRVARATQVRWRSCADAALHSETLAQSQRVVRSRISPSCATDATSTPSREKMLPRQKPRAPWPLGLSCT